MIEITTKSLQLYNLKYIIITGRFHDVIIFPLCRYMRILHTLSVELLTKHISIVYSVIIHEIANNLSRLQLQCDQSLNAQTILMYYKILWKINSTRNWCKNTRLFRVVCFKYKIIKLIILYIFKFQLFQRWLYAIFV